MKVAIIGSRNLIVEDLEKYVPKETTIIVSGGARGIDTCARDYARKKGLIMVEFFPDYEKYGRRAPIIRNDRIIDYADLVIAFWDGKSHGTKYVIDNCKKINKQVIVYEIEN